MVNVNSAIDNNQLNRSILLKNMGFGKKIKNVPLKIENAVEEVINPFMVYKFSSEMGFPKEKFLEELEAEGIIVNWTDWCELWFWNFTNISHKSNFFL